MADLTKSEAEVTPDTCPNVDAAVVTDFEALRDSASFSVESGASYGISKPFSESNTFSFNSLGVNPSSSRLFK